MANRVRAICPRSLNIYAFGWRRRHQYTYQLCGVGLTGFMRSSHDLHVFDRLSTILLQRKHGVPWLTWRNAPCIPIDDT